MTTRHILDSSRVHPTAAAQMNRHADTIREIEKAIADNAVVVVGMAQNPHVRTVRKALKEAGIDFRYLEYGSYLSGWKQRLAIKLWSGWPTFPQVYVRGVLIGGTQLTQAAIADGTLRARLAEPHAATAPS
ncbi:MAG TPA: glutaredoxin domain-containing protein [Labilithrix sp.]|jgi:glutaredoxin-related protein|nr:glutaredoxin domain-containing protein [Labilithrix sp.]